MSVKHRYYRTRPPGEGPRVPTSRFVSNRPPPLGGRGEPEKCTCWVLLRGEGAQAPDRYSVDCELVPDPSCPVHGKRRYPILDDEDWGE